MSLMGIGLKLCRYVAQRREGRVQRIIGDEAESSPPRWTKQRICVIGPRLEQALALIERERMSRRSILAAALPCLVAATFCAPAPALAETWPQRPIRLILPASAGGNSDILGRLLADRLKDSLGQPVIMDYRAGAAGRIAAEAGAKAEPDGYTFFMTSSAPHGVVPALYRKLSYDPVKSFVPVARLATTPNVLYVAANSRFKSLAELLAFAKASPGKVTFASAGFGTTMHMSALLMGIKSGAEFVNVPYKGGSEALIGILGGNVDAAFESLPVAKSQIEGGQIRALAITSRERSPELPDVPTMAEAGSPGIEALGWYGILAPVGTPASIVDRMAAALKAALADEKLIAQLRKQLGTEAAYMPGPEFQEFFKADIATWLQVVEQTGIPRE